MKKHLPILAVLAVSIAVHFAFFGYPKETVFDEVHFGKFVSGYFTHEYFFDIHPPLGKLLISGAGYLAGFEPGFSFGQIGDQFPDRMYLVLRLLPRLAGTLLPVIVVLLLLQLGFSRIGAMSAGLFVVLENSLLVQSRFMLLDLFLLLFGFMSWWLYARYRNKPTIHYPLLTSAAILAGLAMSVKWTGVTFLGVIGILEFIELFKQQTTRAMRPVILLAVVPVTVYFSVFAVHFSLLSKPGPGDAFMSQEFRDGKLNSVQKFIELNREMYRANARLTATHPYSSTWYTWPVMQRPIYYWNEGLQRIYLIGNPLIWWASTFGILYVLVSAILERNKFYLLLGGAYLVNLLPFIGISRAMFLYHYFVGLIIAIIALVHVIDQQKSRKKIFAGLLLASLAVFIFFAPLSYGRDLSDKAFNYRMWFDSWR